MADPTQWQRLAKRIRVPMGFAFAALYLLCARPTPRLLLWSVLPVAAGLLLRGYAAGYVKKNAELTTTGPYAYTRNPLYLGSMLIAFGFGAASGRLWLVLLLSGLFLLIYVPVIRGEERWLRAHFSAFDAYAARVPRLLPRFGPAPAKPDARRAGSFRGELYRKHREYNALMGAVAIYGALLLRLLLLHHQGPDTSRM